MAKRKVSDSEEDSAEYSEEHSSDPGAKAKAKGKAKQKAAPTVKVGLLQTIPRCIHRTLDRNRPESNWNPSLNQPPSPNPMKRTSALPRRKQSVRCGPAYVTLIMTPVTLMHLKQNKPSSSGIKALKNKDGEKYIDLGKKKHATVRTFKGIQLLDIREFYDAQGEEKPGKKGISLTLDQVCVLAQSYWQLSRVNQWNVLKAAGETIDKLFQEVKVKK